MKNETPNTKAKRQKRKRHRYRFQVRIQTLSKTPYLKNKGVPLNEFKFPFGIVTELKINDYRIWKKLISMGIFPGQGIHILNRANTDFIIEVKGCKIAINNKLAKNIILTP
ncbi:MAG: FeoA family protein [Promethearchaeia archaeon]